MLKRTVSIFIICILIIGMFGSVNATELETRLDVVQQASGTKDGQANISKIIVDSNSNTGEVTVELKISNIIEGESNSADTEIFLVVDNSPSMDSATSTEETRKEVILNSANQLIESIFNISSNVKVGLVDFQGSRGVIADATVRQKLTDDKNVMLNAIKDELKRSTGSGTNIEAGLINAKNNFSTSNNNKVLILLTDGIPNASVNSVSSGEGSAIQNATRQALLDLKASGIYTITMLTGMSESDTNIASAEKIFGTQANPTADKYYLTKTADMSNIITKDIFQDVSNKINKPMNGIKVVDYFPSEIIKNFDFSYVGNASSGTATNSIDTKNNTIEWNIGTLKKDGVATLKYKLKIKDMKNKELLNKIIPTNEKVILTYLDTDSKSHTVTLSDSPKIRLSEIKEEVKPKDLTTTVSYDSTAENVKVTIKANKKINKIDGWSLSDDGMTLTKTYSKNTTETIHIVDADNITKDIVITVSDIENSDNNGDNKNNTNSDNKGNNTSNTDSGNKGNGTGNTNSDNKGSSTNNGNKTDNTTLNSGVLPQARSKSNYNSIYNF